MAIENLERIFTLTISFLMVAILSPFLEKAFNLLNIEQKRPTSPLKKHKDFPHLIQFVSRYTAIGYRYLQLILIAVAGLLLEWGLRTGIENTNFIFIFPSIIIFLPISFLIICLCVPKKSKDFFNPYRWEWALCTLLFVSGLSWLIFILK